MMRRTRLYCLAMVMFAVLNGCNNASSEPKPEHVGANSAGAAADVDDEVTAALAELSEEDRQLAEAQRFCAVMPDSRLGSMGAPVKVMVEGQPVFLCCEGCKDKALADPQETLANVKKLKDANVSRTTTKSTGSE